jgi:helix-turn-helix protein
MIKRIVLLATALIISAPTALPASAGGPETTKAEVNITVKDKSLALQHDEQIAFMFVIAISDLENECTAHAGRGCTLDELVSGRVTSKDSWEIGRLKFDPRTTDPNYTYTLNAGEENWEVKATPKKPGLGGFYVVGSGMFPKVFYNPKGEASIVSTETNGYSIIGDTFKAP